MAAGLMNRDAKYTRVSAAAEGDVKVTGSFVGENCLKHQKVVVMIVCVV